MLRHAGCHACPVPASFYPDIAEHPRAAEIAAALGPTLDALLVGNVDLAWDAWSRWRDEQREELPLGTASPREIGVTYCAAAQGGYAWLERVLRTRHLQTEAAGGFPPADRLRREKAARSLADLFLSWSSRDRPEASAREVFATARRHLLYCLLTNADVEEPGATEDLLGALRGEAT